MSVGAAWDEPAFSQGVALLLHAICNGASTWHVWDWYNAAQFCQTNTFGVFIMQLYYMAEVFAPFFIQRTMCNLTFYVMEGRNFVRKKSSLTRKKVLYSSQFENTRHYAGLMAKASKIGSVVYNALPEYWRQGWMYRSFTGEAYTMLRARKPDTEIQQVLLQRYVEPVINRQPVAAMLVPLPATQKRAYRKLNNAYWQGKSIKSARRKVNKQRLLYNAGLLARASKIGSKLYAQVPTRYRDRSYYQYLTGLAMQLLKAEWDEADIIDGLLPTLPTDQPVKHQQPATKKITAGLVIHPKGQYHFIISRKNMLMLRPSHPQKYFPHMPSAVAAKAQRHFICTTNPHTIPFPAPSQTVFTGNAAFFFMVWSATVYLTF